MSNYTNEINTLSNIKLQKLVDLSIQKLPENKRRRPWSFVNHGISLLETEDELNCYLAAYASMHEAKIKKALESLPNPRQIFDNQIAIVDWGCGQGLATICLFDFLKENNLPNNINEILLIEPSIQALERAKAIVNIYVKDAGKIKTINKFLDDVSVDDISTKHPITLQFFSNILDITTIDLQRLAKLIKENLIGENYFFCVSPLNSQSTRIEKFAEYFDINKEDILNHSQGKLDTTRGTIKLLVFKIKGKEREIIKTDYYPPIPNNINYIYMIEKILQKINPATLNETDKIIEFYKTVVELEQQKEPQIKNFWKYEIPNISNNIISLNLPNNKEFLIEFLKNAGPLTRWPKDLFVGMNATLDDKSYTLLNQIIPFEDVKDIDVTTQNIPINLSSFEIYLKSLRELELPEEQISEIEEAVANSNSLDEIKNIFEQKINGLSFDNNFLYLSLSSKNPALSQIYSELRRISNHIIKGSLAEAFLLHKKIDNKINNLKEEDLIQVSNLDESQKKAVLAAFNNKLSVITGPPGSGKTQVILNIVANAVLQNKKILVASKNNKAVDNVKERFDKIDETGFLLRFGSKKILKDITIPAIEKIIFLKPTFENNTNTIENLKYKIDKYKRIIKENEAELLKRDHLKREIQSIEQKIKEKKQKIDILKKNNKKFDFFRESYDVEKLDNLKGSLKIKKNDLEAKYTGIKKLWFNWFSKKKYAGELLNAIEQYPYDIKKFIQEQKFKSQINEFNNGDDIIFLYSKIIEIFDTAIDYTSKIKILNDELNKLLNEFENNKIVIQEITNKEPEILSDIEISKKEIMHQPPIIRTELVYNYTNYFYSYYLCPYPIKSFFERGAGQV